MTGIGRGLSSTLPAWQTSQAAAAPGKPQGGAQTAVFYICCQAQPRLSRLSRRTSQHSPCGPRRPIRSAACAGNSLSSCWPCGPTSHAGCAAGAGKQHELSAGCTAVSMSGCTMLASLLEWKTGSTSSRARKLRGPESMLHDHTLHSLYFLATALHRRLPRMRLRKAVARKYKLCKASSCNGLGPVLSHCSWSCLLHLASR